MGGGEKNGAPFLFLAPGVNFSGNGFESTVLLPEYIPLEWLWPSVYLSTRGPVL